MKDIIYIGDTEKIIVKFSSKAKQRISALLDTLRAGLTLHPKEFKYMSNVGHGVYELRVKVNTLYRVFYVTKFDSTIYVLHAFVKKSQKTSQQDISIGKQRYKMLTKYWRINK